MSDWIKTAKVGDRVVCIECDWNETTWDRDETQREIGDPRVPMVNEVLTISEIAPGIAEQNKHIVWLYFEELEEGYDSTAFRPLNDRPISLSVFTDMLKTVGKPVTEDA